MDEFDIPNHVDEGVTKDEKIMMQYTVETKKCNHLLRRIALDIDGKSNRCLKN